MLVPLSRVLLRHCIQVDPEIILTTDRCYQAASILPVVSTLRRSRASPKSVSALKETKLGYGSSGAVICGDNMRQPQPATDTDISYVDKYTSAFIWSRGSIVLAHRIGYTNLITLATEHTSRRCTGLLTHVYVRQFFASL